MKLYDGGRAPNPRRVSVFLAEKNINIERVSVDMGSLEHKSDLVSARNPLQKLPILELDDGTILTETMAICRYLEGLYPTPTLMGNTLLEQAQIEMWQRRVEFGLLMPVAHAFRHIHPAMAGWEVPQIAEWGEANKPKALAFCDLLNQELAKGDFIAGDGFSVADITAVIAMDFMKPARIVVPDHNNHLLAYYQRMKQRACFAL